MTAILSNPNLVLRHVRFAHDVTRRLLLGWVAFLFILSVFGFMFYMLCVSIQYMQTPRLWKHVPYLADSHAIRINDITSPTISISIGSSQLQKQKALTLNQMSTMIQYSWAGGLALSSIPVIGQPVGMGIGAWIGFSTES